MNNFEQELEKNFIGMLEKDTYKNLEEYLDKLFVNIRHLEKLLLMEYRSYINLLEGPQMEKTKQQKEVIENYEKKLIFFIDRENKVEEALERRKNK
ncbi:hypothetical protein AB6D75_18750 [Vibrio splendidus]